MVKIAVAGGTGNVATELLRAPIKSDHHSITIFTRSYPPSSGLPGVSYIQVDYHDLSSLTASLRGFDTVLSFLVAHLDEENITQKNLITACISANVRRFAPSEWSLTSNSGVPAYANKDWIANHLAELKENGKLGNLQYCLFQPSVFTDYFAHPSPLSSGLHTWPFFIDFENRRAMVLDEGDYPIVLTTVADDSEILARALDDDRPWPTVGGIQGSRTCINDILAIGKKVRGGEWTVEYVKSEDVEKSELKTSWVPAFSHPAVPLEQRERFSTGFVLDFFKAMKSGAWNVNDAWNQRFPEYDFTTPETYLAKAWAGKP